MLIYLIITFIAIAIFLRGRKTKKLSDTSKRAVLITGCDSGIGFQCAKFYHSLGFTVFAGCLFPEGEGAGQLVQETDSDRLIILDLDVTDEKKAENALNLVKTELETRGKYLWGLVNNAGVLVLGEFLWYTWEQCQRQIDVNLTGTIRITRMFLPLLKKNKGRVITITSNNARMVYPTISVYCATKHALEGFLNSLRIELKRFNVHIVAIELGDFAALTGIAKNHPKNAEDMWNAMSLEERKDYYYFDDFNKKAGENVGLTGYKRFEDSPLMEHLSEAILAEKPKVRYITASLGMQLFFSLTRWMSIELYSDLMYWGYSYKFFKNRSSE